MKLSGPFLSSEDYERTAKCARNGPAEGLSKLTWLGAAFKL